MWVLKYLNTLRTFFSSFSIMITLTQHHIVSSHILCHHLNLLLWVLNEYITVIILQFLEMMLASWLLYCTSWCFTVLCCIVCCTTLQDLQRKRKTEKEIFFSESVRFIILCSPLLPPLSIISVEKNEKVDHKKMKIKKNN